MLRKIAIPALILILSIPLLGFDGDYCPRFRTQTISVLDVKKEQRFAIIEAVKEWNKLLGFNYFNFNEYCYTLKIKTESSSESNFLGINTGEEIKIPEGISFEEARVAGLHHLGHAIGLEHALNPLSIMFQVMSLMKAKNPSQEDVNLALGLIESKICKNYKP